MNKEDNLIKDFSNSINKLRLWQTQVLEEVSLQYVINNLLKEKFVVEIEEEKYDILFGIYENNGIGFSNSVYPSKSITSYDLIEKGFKYGKWYIITNKQLPMNIIKEQLEKQYNKELEENLKFFKELNENVNEKYKFDLDDIKNYLYMKKNEEIKNILDTLENKKEDNIK